jgi:RNA polymerase sigma-70 factor (ECF subfamily)
MKEFEKMIVSNVEFLKPFAFTLTKDNESAKDLTQETLYRALANKEKYNVGTNLKAWMYTIMRNIFINDYRKKARQNVVLDHTSNDFFLDHNQSAVKNEAESKIRFKEIHDEITKLPDIFKHPFILFYEGYKYNEIADYLQEPLGTVKSRIHFARKLLKESINRY